MLQGRACFPRRSHLRLDDQHAAQSPCLAILVPLGMWRLIGNKRHRGSGGWPHPYPRSTGPDHAAMHPLRRDTPDPSQYTRSEGVQCLRIGCTASHNKHNRGQFLPTDPTGSIERRHTASTCSPRLRTRSATPVTGALHHLRAGVTPLSNMPNRGHSLPTHHNRQHRTQPHDLEIIAPIPRKSRCTRYVALHPLRRDAPDQKGCNAYGSGAPPPTTSTTAGNSSPQTPTVCIGRRHTASTCSPRLRTRGAAPVSEHYTTSELCNTR